MDRYGDTFAALVCPDGELHLWVDGPDGVAIPLDGIDEYLTTMQALADTARRLSGGGE